MSNFWDVIVIGSGFGGAVAACRLAEKGMRVLILERGRRWETKDFPREPGDAWLYDANKPQKKNGWLDFRLFPNMTVVQGAGVGGGSLHYANVSLIPPPERFAQGWPSEITYQEMLPYYEAVGRMLNVQKIPETQLTARSRLMKQAADKLGYGNRFERLDVAVTFDPDWNYNLPDLFNHKHSKKHLNAHGKEQGTCIHLGNCDLGCDVNARNTLDLNYIAAAEKHGAEVRPMHLVRYLKPENGGYRVYFDRIENGALIPGHETAAKVILAAGTLNSTEILLRCRDQYKTLPNLSQVLGHHWSANGNFLTPAFHEHPQPSPTHGPTITCAIPFLDGSIDNERFTIEEGGMPPLLKNYLLSVIGTKSKKVKISKFRMLLEALAKELRGNDPLSNVMPWFANGVDAANGRLYLGRLWYAPCKKSLKLDWDVSCSEKLFNTIIKMHKKMAEATGGKAWVAPTWTVLKDLITPHPLGGCRMGATPNDGVVNHRGEVFGHPNLYVTCGAVIPKAIGLNPSRTIAAVAERMAHLIEK